MNATDYSYSVGSNSVGTSKVSAFGFSNAGQIGNTMQAAGAGVDLVSSWMAGNALSSAANTTEQTGLMNRAILYKRAAVTDENAKYIKWKGDFEFTRIRQEADLNLKLADLSHTEALRAADITLQSGYRTLALSEAKAKEFGTEAESVWTTAATRSLRAYQQGRGVLGAQRVATAKAGFVMGGSELDSLLENANRLELARLDDLTTSAEQARQLRFAGSMARYEGQETAFQQGETYRAQTLSAELDMYKAGVTFWNAEQTAQITLLEAKQSAWNAKQQAQDLRDQGDLALAQARAQAAALEAQSKGKKASGILGALTTVASIFA